MTFILDANVVNQVSVVIDSFEDQGEEFSHATHELTFPVEIPAVGFKLFFVKRSDDEVDITPTDTDTLGNEVLTNLVIKNISY